MLDNKTSELLQISEYGTPIIKGSGYEVRLNDDGTLDEIVLYDKDERCVFHLEQMSEKSYWMGCYPNETDIIHANIGVKNGKLWANACDAGSPGDAYWEVPAELTDEHRAQMKQKQKEWLENLRKKRSEES